MSTRGLRIGITSRISQAQGYPEQRDALAHDWTAFMQAAMPDAAWMPLPNAGAGAIRKHCASWGINRLILTGGDDIGATPIRDTTEQDLIVWAENARLPVLGICRGMQLMATYAGASLKHLDGHVRSRHMLFGDISQETNSYHTQGLMDCPNGFVVTATTSDGEIEGIRSTKLPWEGWMWHPEREHPFSHIDIQRLRNLFA